LSGSSRRRMVAVDSELAEMLKQAAERRGYSLYSLVNRLVKSYLELEAAGEGDPLEFSMDYLLVRSYLSLGFHLAPPEVQGAEAWAAMGQALWSVVSSRVRGRDPVHVLARALATLFGEKSVSVIAGPQLSIVISVPQHLKIPQEGAKAFLEAMAKSALPGREVEARAVSNILVLSVK